MIEKILKTIEKYSMIEQDDSITVALSGGADSVCLMIVLKEISEKFNLDLDAIHINHCIRGEESDRDEQFCKDICQTLEIPLQIRRADIPQIMKTSGKSIEETARDVRYKIFAEHSKNGSKIATAHTLSDNSETVILNLTRGTGLKGLCGIPPVRKNIIRPLIEITRSQVEDFLIEKNMKFVTDSTNLSDDYTRNRIRHKIIPELENINHGFFKTLGRTLENLEDENDFLSQYCENEYRKRNTEKGLMLCGEIHKAVRKRLIAKFLNENNLPVSSDTVNSVSLLSEKNGKLNIKKGVYITSEQGFVNILFQEKKSDPMEIPLKSGTNTLFENKVLIAEENINGEFCIDLDKTHGKVMLRNRRYGDKIRFSGRNFTSSVKKLLNEKVAPCDRPYIHFLCDDEGLIFMEGFGIAERVKPDENSVNILSVKVKEVK